MSTLPTPALPFPQGVPAPSPELIAALQDAVLYAPPAPSRAATRTSAPSPRRPPMARSAQGSPNRPATARPTPSRQRPTRHARTPKSAAFPPTLIHQAASTRSPASPGARIASFAHRPGSSRASTANGYPAIVVWGAESWATDDEAAEAVRACQAHDVVIATREALALLYELGILEEGRLLVLLTPEMLSLDEPFMDVLRSEANVVYDMTEHFERIDEPDDDKLSLLGLADGAEWSYKGGLEIPQRLLDAIYFQQRCMLDGLSLPPFVAHMARPVGCEPEALLPHLLEGSQYIDYVHELLEAIAYYGCPNIRSSLHLQWMLVPARLASPDVALLAAVGTSASAALADCERMFGGDVNVLMPTDTREELIGRLRALGSEMEAAKMLDMRLLNALCQLELDGVIGKGAARVEKPAKSVFGFLAKRLRERACHVRS